MWRSGDRALRGRTPNMTRMPGGNSSIRASALRRDIYRTFLSLFGLLIGPLLAAQPPAAGAAGVEPVKPSA